MVGYLFISILHITCTSPTYMLWMLDLDVLLSRVITGIFFENKQFINSKALRGCNSCTKIYKFIKISKGSLNFSLEYSRWPPLIKKFRIWNQKSLKLTKLDFPSKAISILSFQMTQKVAMRIRLVLSSPWISSPNTKLLLNRISNNPIQTQQTIRHTPKLMCKWAPPENVPARFGIL